MLATTIDRLFESAAENYGPEYQETFAELKRALNSGEVRAAEPCSDSALGWKVNVWVKRGILLGFRIGAVVDMSADHGRFPFFDKGTFPLRQFDVSSGVRIVPGGSSIRDGCYVGAASPACRPCTSTWGRMWMKQRWSIPTPWWAVARRWASGST